MLVAPDGHEVERGGQPLRVFLVEDDEDDYVLTRDLLAEISGQASDLEWVSNYDAALGVLAQDRHDVNIPLDARADTVYRVLMNVQGSEFSVEVQGQIADSWTESRLPRGGVGFFTASGEASRLRWVQITHQYDMLGRLCAYLAPYDTTNGSWQP